MATDFPASPSNGDTHAGFTYNSTTGAWESSPTSSNINSLTDVDTSTNAPTTGQLLQWNGSNWVPYSQIVEVDQWRLNAILTTNADPITTVERVDNLSFAKIGTGMNVSSGVWTFPRTGVYQIGVIASVFFDNINSYVSLRTHVSTDGGSNWERVADALTSRTDGNTNEHNEGFSTYLLNVTNTSNVVVKFQLYSLSGTNNYVIGNTDVNTTTFTFIRLGDSQ